MVSSALSSALLTTKSLTPRPVKPAARWSSSFCVRVSLTSRRSLLDSTGRLLCSLSGRSNLRSIINSRAASAVQSIYCAWLKRDTRGRDLRTLGGSAGASLSRHRGRQSHCPLLPGDGAVDPLQLLVGVEVDHHTAAAHRPARRPGRRRTWRPRSWR